MADLKQSLCLRIRNRQTLKSTLTVEKRRFGRANLQRHEYSGTSKFWKSKTTNEITTLFKSRLSSSRQAITTISSRRKRGLHLCIFFCHIFYHLTMQNSIKKAF